MLEKTNIRIKATGQLGNINPKLGKKLNLGCGTQIYQKEDGWVNVDIQKGKEIDKTFNFDKFPYPFKDNTFDYVLVDNVLEHLEDINKVMKELWRICKKDAIIEIFVPYWNHSVAYNDPTHKHYFNTRTFEVICDKNSSYKANPEKKFELVNVERTPGEVKKKLPLPILNFLDKFFHSMFIQVHALIKVLK